MKWIKLLIIVISLSLPIHSYACWDDDMDDDDEGWYNNNDDDDWWNDDDDCAWEIDLPEVDITPDNDDSWADEDDWWRTDYGDDDDSWDDSSDDDDVGSWTNTDEKNYINAPDYWKNQTWHIMNIFLIGRNGRIILSIGNLKLDKVVFLSLWSISQIA